MKHLLYSGLLLLCCTQLTEVQAQKPATARPALPQADVKAILCGVTPDSSVGNTLYYTVSAAELSAMYGLCVQAADISWTINRMHIISMPKNLYMEDVMSNQGAFSDIIKKWFSGARTGDRFVFDNLKAVNASGTESPMGQILIYIR